MDGWPAEYTDIYRALKLAASDLQWAAENANRADYERGNGRVLTDSERVELVRDLDEAVAAWLDARQGLRQGEKVGG